MAKILGQSVPKIKANLSHDLRKGMGHPVQMAEDIEKQADIEWAEGFRRRIVEARGKRTQLVMAELLGISRDAYSKYEGSRKSMIPTRLLPRFCKICAVDLEWLINGDAETAAPAKRKPEPIQIRRKA